MDIKDKRGELQLFYMSFIFPLLLMVALFTITYGAAAYAKSATVTAAREGARSYAVTHNTQVAMMTAKDIIVKTLPPRSDCFKDSDIQFEEVTFGGQQYCKATVTYRSPVFAPDLPKLFNLPGWGRYITVTSTAYFLKEYTFGG